MFKKSNNALTILYADNVALERVERFTYLRCLINYQLDHNREIRQQI